MFLRRLSLNAVYLLIETKPKPAKKNIKGTTVLKESNNDPIPLKIFMISLSDIYFTYSANDQLGRRSGLIVFYESSKKISNARILTFKIFYNLIFLVYSSIFPKSHSIYRAQVKPLTSFSRSPANNRRGGWTLSRSTKPNLSTEAGPINNKL